MKHKDKKKRLLIYSSVIVIILGGSIWLNEESKEIETLSVTTDISEENFKDELLITPLSNDMKIIRPEKNNINTSEQKIVFSGMSDPNLELKLNGEVVDVYYTGNFILEKELNEGVNNFCFTLGDKSINYIVNRTEKIIGSVSPSKIMECMEESKVEISVKAYSGSEVYAVINGTEIPLKQIESNEYIAARGTTYAKYAAYYDVPSVSQDTNLGEVQFISKFDGKETKKNGGSILVKNKMQNEFIARVKSERAFTYEDDNLSVTPLINSAYLPKETMDYVVCKTKLDDKEYINLACGKRVKAEDVDIISATNNLDNEISNITVSQVQDKTVIKLKTSTKTPYDLQLNDISFKDEENSNYAVDSYEVSNMTLSFHNLKSITKDIEVEDNNLIKSVKIDDENEIVLELQEDKIYCGNNSYYDEEGNLIIELRNVKSNLSDMTIVLDPGHGLVENNLVDTGALGFNDLHENKLNYNICLKLKNKLENKGAKVVMLNTESTSYPLKKRGLEARKNDADLYISIHNNSGANGKLNATETYYFTPYSMDFAKNINESLTECYKNKIFGNKEDNYTRGHKFNDFTVTLEKTNPSVLVEVGYIENPISFDKLIRDEYQEKASEAIVEGIENSIY